MASLRELPSMNSELSDDADENESGFVGSFAYGETRKNDAFVRLCTDGILDEGDGMCAFPCIRILTVDCACDAGCARVPTMAALLLDGKEMS